MNKNDFYNQLELNDLEVTFEKKTDGTLKTMRCSANNPLSNSQKRKASPDNLVTVYDIDAKNWRSFYVDNIKEMKILDSSFGLLQE